MMDPIKIGVLFFILYFFLVVTLVVAGLALGHVRKIASLTEEHIGELREEQERLQFFYYEKHKSLEEELERERQERVEAQKNLEQEHQQRLEAQLQAEQAKQEAMREATLQLREQMDLYLKELDEDGRRDIRRVK
jgi:biopolymer transport protein ExbB/TolQ